MTPPPPHRSSTAQLQAAYPFVAEAGLAAEGTYIGRDLFGGAFCFDPWECYEQGLLTSPNVVVLGQIGRGKSTFVKTFLRRQAVFGRQAWVVDPKGEYAALALAAGVIPLRLVPGGPLRLNPLDSLGSSSGAGSRSGAGAAELLCSIASSSLGHPLTPPQRTAVGLAVGTAGERRRQPTLPDVVTAMLDPDPVAAASVHTDAAGLAADGRDVALELRRLVRGDLAGMFDAETSRGIDLGGPLSVLDLSALYASPALPVLMACATAWLQAAMSNGVAAKRLVVVDEAWAILRDLATARWLQSTFKLSRAYGVANIAVVHRLSDLRAVGADGSEHQRLAQGLLADSETRVVFAQPASEVEEATEALGLTSTEATLLPRLPRGVALWRVGERSFVVEHAVGAAERTMVDTDGAMRAPGGPDRLGPAAPTGDERGAVGAGRRGGPAEP